MRLFRRKRHAVTLSFIGAAQPMATLMAGDSLTITLSSHGASDRTDIEVRQRFTLKVEGIA